MTKREEEQKLSIRKIIEEAHKDAQKLSDRELLVKTFGTVEWLKGVMGNGGGVLEDIRQLWKAQAESVTRKELMLTVGIISVVLMAVGALVVLLTR